MNSNKQSSVSLITIVMLILSITVAYTFLGHEKAMDNALTEEGAFGLVMLVVGLFVCCAFRDTVRSLEAQSIKL